MKRIFSITMLIIGLLASRVFAESISDLYLEALPEAKKASQKTGANPFSSTTTSLADLHLEDLVLMGTAVGEGDDQYAL
ncbi:MAG: hypothetical protein HY540_00790, partial [Deltaproteobacteria bacterium]|nr:hypothetical protein [Deltaproteobacteria bacterium]